MVFCLEVIRKPDSVPISFECNEDMKLRTMSGVEWYLYLDPFNFVQDRPEFCRTGDKLGMLNFEITRKLVSKIGDSNLSGPLITRRLNAALLPRPLSQQNFH